MKKDRFDTLLGDKLQDYRENPPFDMFARIEKSLADRTLVPEGVAPAGKRRPFVEILLRYGVAAAVLVGALLTALYYMRVPGSQDPEVDLAKMVAETQNQEVMFDNLFLPMLERKVVENAIPVEQLIPDEESGNGLSDIVRRALSPERDENRQVRPESRQLADLHTVQVSLPMAGPKSESYDRAEETYETKRIELDERPIRGEDRREDLNSDPEPTAVQHRKNPVVRKNPEIRESMSDRHGHRRMSASLYAGNFGVGRGDMEQTAQNMLRSYDNIMSNPTPPTGTPWSGVALNNFKVSSPSFSDIKLQHSMPVSVGVAFAFPLGPRVAIETGLNYSYLHSSGDTKNDLGSGLSMKQELHYLGIPLGVTYLFLSSRSIDFYARGGAMIEKAIFARWTEKVLDESGRTTSQEIYNKKIKGIQPSVDASLGAMFKLSPTMGIYVEPGVAYYIEQTDQPANYRTENSVSFSLRVGMRFTGK